MFCEKCGTKLSDDAKFCERCGATTALVEEQQSEPAIEMKPRMRSKKLLAIIIAGLCGLAVVSACIAAAIIIPQKEVNSFKKQIQSRSYMDAVATYEALSGEDRTKANKWLSEYVLDIEQDYYDGKLDYSTASNRLSELIQFDAVFNQMTEVSQNVYLDNQSTIAFEKAKNYADAEKWQEAYLAMQGIHIKYRLYDDVAELRGKCAENYRAEVLEQISTYAANKEIAMLISAREDALEILADDIEIIQACQTYLDNYVEEILAMAEQFVKEGDYTGAIKTLTNASGAYPNQQFTNAMDNYYYESTIAHCEALIAKNDLLGAVSELKDVLHMDVRYQSKYDEYGQMLVEKTLATAKEYANKRQFQQAIDILKEVQIVYASESMNNAVDNYTKHLPISLVDCYEVSQGGKGSVYEDAYQDSMGNFYTNCIGIQNYVYSEAGSTYIIYNIDDRYANLTGTLAYSTGYYKAPQIVKIYLDDKLVYTSAELSVTSQPISFAIDVSGAKLLKVECYGEKSGSCIIDAKLS